MDFHERVAGAVDRIMRKHKKSLLTNLAIDEISIVDHPANPGAQVALFKHDTVTDSAIVRLAKRRRAEAEGEDTIDTEVAKASQSPLVRLAAERRRQSRAERERRLRESGTLDRLPARERDAMVRAVRSL